MFKTQYKNAINPVTLLLSTSVAIASLTGCDSDSTTEPEDQSVSLKFAAAVGDEAFECGKVYENIGTGAGNQGKLKIVDFRYFVSDVKLLKADGSMTAVDLDQDGKWQYENIALLDFEDGCNTAKGGDLGSADMNSSIKGTVAKANYTGVCLTVGVPFEHNHLDTAAAPAPLNNSAMFWNWQGGHKFIRVDGVGDPGTEGNASQGFNLHLGSTGCAAPDKTTSPGANCSTPNTITYCYGKDGSDTFDIEKDTLVFDVKTVLSESLISANAPDTVPGCMAFPGDADCPAVMPRLGLSYSLDNVTYPAEEQQLIRVQKGS